MQEDLAGQGFQGVVLATGVVPRNIKLPGADHPKVVSYIDVLRHNVQVRRQVDTEAGGHRNTLRSRFAIGDGVSQECMPAD